MDTRQVFENTLQAPILPHNKIIRIDTDEKLYRQYRIIIKSVAILFEVKISGTICTINKLYGK